MLLQAVFRADIVEVDAAFESGSLEATYANETPMTVITLIEAYQHKRLLVRRNPLVDLDAVVQPLKYESRFFLVHREITIEFQLLDLLLQLVE